MTADWRVSRLDETHIEAVGGPDGIRYVYRRNPDGTWDGRLANPEKLMEAYERMGLSSAEMSKEAAKLARSAGDAVLEHLNR